MSSILRLMLRPWLVWMLVLVVLNARSQGFLFDRITAADGLPNDEVHSLFEDRDGYIWAGTVDGLARLEGSRIRVFHHDHNDSTTLAHDQVNGIAQDASGTLWFATMDGLSMLDARSGTFNNRRIAATGNAARQANRMQQVLALGDTLLWLVTEAGLYRYRVQAGAFEFMQGRAPGEGPAGMVNASGAVCWDAERGKLWAGTHEGLASWDARTDRWADHRNTTDEPWATVSSTNIPVVHGDSLWFLRNKPYTLFAYDLRSALLHPQPDLEEQPNLFTLRSQGFDAEGGHWLSTWTHRVFHRPKYGSWQEALADEDRPGALPSARVNGLLFTGAGERWFATARGIALLRGGSSATSLLPFDSGGTGITALRMIGQDTLLVGTGGNGVHVFDLREGTTTHHQWDRAGEEEGAQRDANIIRALGPRCQGGYLVCTGHGLALLEMGNPGLMALRAIEREFPRAPMTAFTLAERVDGIIWLGTWSSGLWRYDEHAGTCERVDTAGGPHGRLPSRMILCALQDREGRLWVGMNNGGGVARMDRGKFQAVIGSDGANLGGVVRCMAQGQDGRIWLGTHEQGIVVFDPVSGNSRYFTRRDGLPGTRIEALTVDRGGRLWAATTGGFAFMPPGATAFRTLSLPAGFPGEEASALIELPDGRLVLACGQRLLVHDPSITAPVDQLAAVFTGYRINDRWMLGAPPLLELPHDRKALTLELGTTGYHFGQRPQFRYRLSAAEPAWSELGTSARIDLFDLPPGRHAIEVQASGDGVSWGSASALALIEVLPPFHNTWWFRSLMVVMVVGLSFIGFRLYLSARLRKQREAFEREQAVLAERMRIAGDMHDDLGAGLSALKLRSEMALRVEKDPIKREQLGSLASTAGDLIGSMRQIIWTMNADQSSIEDLVTYTTHYARTYCEQNGLVPEIMAIKEWPAVQLTSEQRRNIFLVVKEALHNVVKHANARTVRLVLGWSEGLLVDVQDDGVGLPAHTQHSVGNGLRNMRKRIETLGGTIGMERGMGLPGDLTGTRIRFSVPMGANQSSIVRRGVPQDLRRP